MSKSTLDFRSVQTKVPVTKTVGVRDVVKESLLPLVNRVRLAFIYGSVARHAENASSDIDLLVVGDVGFNEVVSNLAQAEKRLSREINPAVYPIEEFRSKRKANNHFLSTVLRQEKVFVVGDENELRQLG